jgi:hypothetical protein
MEIRYQLFEKDNLLIQKFIGVISIESYMAYNRSIMQRAALNSITKILNDFRDLVFDDDLDDFNERLDSIIEYRRKVGENILKNNDLNILFWVDKPLPTTIAVLFSSNFSESSCKYCTLSEDVIDMLKLPKQFTNLNSIINNLENTY